jgi:hypothetical protein
MGKGLPPRSASATGRTERYHEGGISFSMMAAMRKRADRCCTAWHVEGAYDTLVEVDDSPWVKEMRADTQELFRYTWGMHHYMIYLDSVGCFEVSPSLGLRSSEQHAPAPRRPELLDAFGAAYNQPPPPTSTSRPTPRPMCPPRPTSSSIRSSSRRRTRCQAALGAHTGGVLLSCLLGMLVLGCSHITQRQRQGDVAGKVPRLGESMPAGASVVAVEHKGRQLCTHWIRAGGVRYNFDVSCGASIVVYVQTDDPHFRTPEGIAVGDLFRKARSINGSMMDVIDGTCGIALPSGWIARLGLATETKSSCKERAGEPIGFFDTRFAR